MTDPQDTSNGKNKLFNDSKLGVLVTGGAAAVFSGALNGAIDALTNVDMSGWNSWWGGIAGAVVATALGALTAYKAKRNKARTY